MTLTRFRNALTSVDVGSPEIAVVDKRAVSKHRCTMHDGYVLFRSEEILKRLLAPDISKYAP